MEWLGLKTPALAGGCLALIALQGYGLMSMRTVNERIGSAEREFQSARTQDKAELSRLASALDTVTQHMGVTTEELKEAYALSEKLKQENAQTAQTAQRLRRDLAAKADAKTVKQFHEEATSKLAEVQQDTTVKFGAVTGEVQVVRTDLDATRQDLATSKKELSSQIAHNAGELAELRKRGEREYIEFDVNKSKDFARIADVRVQLKKADVKRQKFDIVIQADDNSITKKDRTANEPVTFLVGPERLRYEFVVNYVDKDRIRGYLSTPKDKTLAAEGPSRQRLQ
jgi:DNA repair exonuclease SbcCD ATPase subunit